MARDSMGFKTSFLSGGRPDQPSCGSRRKFWAYGLRLNHLYPLKANLHFSSFTAFKGIVFRVWLVRAAICPS